MIVANQSDMPVTAFVVAVEIPGFRPLRARFYYDSYVNWRRDIPIPAGSTAQLPLPQVVGGSAKPSATLQAVLFADGSAIGTRVFIESLLRRRQISLARLEEVLQLTEDISRRALGRTEAVSSLKQRRLQRALGNTSAPFEEQLLHDSFFLRSHKKPRGRITP
jgi:hypothetical protein